MINFKKGFSLAEVMVTLTLIGVVAAISIPAVTMDHQKKVNKNKIKNAMTTFDSLIREVDVSLGRKVTTEDIRTELLGENDNCPNLSNYLTIVYNQNCVVSTPDGVWWDFNPNETAGDGDFDDIIAVKVAASKKELNKVNTPGESYKNGAYFMAKRTNEGLQINNDSFIVTKNGCRKPKICIVPDEKNTFTKIITNLEEFKN